MALSRAYVGTNAIGASALALSSTKMYVKKVSLTADTVLATIDAYLHTTDGEQVTVRPVVYTDNGGVPDLMLVGLQFVTDSVEFDGADRWVKLPVGLHIPANGDYWIGVHAPDPGSLTIAYETTGGNDQQINSGGTWTIEPGATGGSITDPGDHLYSIRGSVVSTITSSFVGRTTVGASDQTLTTSVVYLKKVTIPAGGTLATVDAHLKVSVASVPSVIAVVMSDDTNAPDRFLHVGHGMGDAWLLENTYRWFSFPVGLQFAAETVVWIGVSEVDAGTIALAFDATGGADGTLTGVSPRSEAATWTAGTQHYSIRGTVLDATLDADRYGASAFGASEQALDSSIMYAVPVTLPVEGLAVGIEAGIRDTAGDGTSWTNNAALYADNVGAPGDLIASFGASSAGGTFITSESDRWYGFPIFEFLAAGDYWIGFQNGISNGALLYATGSLGDGYEIDAQTANVIPEPGSSGTTLDDTDRQYSLRLVVLTEAAGGTNFDETGRLVTITATVSATDSLNGAVNYDETGRLVTVTSTVTGSDTLTVASSNFDETGRAVVIVATVSESDFFNVSGVSAAVPSLVDGGLRFEAFTPPNVGPFARKFDLSRWVPSFTIAEKWGSISDGRLDLPNDFAKIDRLFKVDKANHANDVGSVVRVLRGTTPITHYVLKGLDDKWSSEGQTLTGLLEGMDYYLDRALVPNFDYPAAPTVEPDWHYGIPSILFNSDFEDAGLTNFLIHLYVEDAVTAGTWNIQFDDGTTVDDVTLNWDADLPAVQTGIEGLSNVADISITGLGTPLNPWVIEVIDPAGTDYNVTIDSTGLTGGSAQHLAQMQGGVGVVDPWTESFNLATGLAHGVYTNFQVSTVQAHSGTSSLYVKGGLGPWPESYPGAQQVVSVTGGRTYRAGVWVFPLFARKYRFVIRTTDETFIAAVEADLAAGSWQRLVVSVTIPNHIRSIIFRLSCISNTDGHEFYLDDGLLAPGMDAATFGKIMGQLLAAAQAAGYLTWVTKTWTDTHDSAGVIWDRDLVWSVKHRQSLLQLVEYADRWNYESDGIHWSIPNQRFEWGIYNPYGGGVNKQNTGLAVIGKVISETGTMSKRIPDASHYYAEGDQGYWGEFQDPTLVGAWGPLQKSYFNAQGSDTASMVEQATRLVENAADRTDGLITRLQAAPVTPWTDFKPGDRNVMVNLNPKRAREYLRCVAIVASKGRGDSAPAYDVHWGSQVYLEEAAHLETTRRLVRAFATQRPSTNLDGRPTIAIPPNVDAQATGVTEIIIAANDTHDSLKILADYICTATDDQDTWRTMITDLGGFTERIGSKGRVKVLDGTYFFDDRLVFNTFGFGKLQFVSEGLPIIKMNYNTVSPTDGFCPLIAIHGSSFSLQTPLSFQNIVFDGNNQSNGICLFESTNSNYPMVNVEQCKFLNWDNNLWWSEGRAPLFFHHNHILDCTFPANNGAFWINSDPNAPVFVTDNIFQGCSGNMAWGNAHTHPTLFDRNIQWTGSMTLNTFAGIVYGTNYSF